VANRIRVLDEGTVNKIAAGEVIERPASVVKELIENSLDAGATSVVVSVEDGGKKSIAVRDDGVGMSRDDAQAAFTRHATSKIMCIEDLGTLMSYGFRGEALSSIASVSRVTVCTREHDAPEGTQVVTEHGRMSSVESAGCAPGTEIIVENIFENIPARLKGLRSKNVELAHIREVITGYVLCRPGLAFSLLSDGQTELAHVPAEEMRGSLTLVFGPKVASNILYGEAEQEGIRVQAYMGRLEQTRPSSAELILFVNDRPVKSQKMIATVLEAYGSKLMKDRYPVGVVRVFVDGTAVDVNVHPSKREVRFADEQKVLGMVKKAVEDSFFEPDLSYKYDLTKFSEHFDAPHRLDVEETTKAMQTTLKVQEKSSEGGGKPLIIPLAQVMGTYILAESGGSLLLIDQHAASERVVYEAVIRSIETGEEVSQRLLSPLVLQLSPLEIRTLEENRETLENAGFVMELFGHGTYALRSIPTVLGIAQGESAFRNILGDLSNMSPTKRVGLEVIWKVACHTAIRAGDPLSESQMRQLISDLMRTGSPYTCEHGRPTMIVLSPTDMERLFKRRL
jgi:DNA mismatch repair protein MutL